MGENQMASGSERQGCGSVKDRISVTLKYEMYVDLWGHTLAWIETIQNALHEFCDTHTDECESYTCPACMAIRFTSTDSSRIVKAERIFKRLSNLANKSVKPCYYVHN